MYCTVFFTSNGSYNGRIYLLVILLIELTFAGVLTMLSRKKFTQKISELRMVVEELLRPLLVNTDGPIEGTIASMPCKE